MDFAAVVLEAITASTVSLWKALKSFTAFMDFSKPSLMASFDAVVMVSIVSFAVFLAVVIDVSPEYLRGGEGFRVLLWPGVFLAVRLAGAFALAFTGRAGCFAGSAAASGFASD